MVPPPIPFEPRRRKSPVLPILAAGVLCVGVVILVELGIHFSSWFSSLGELTTMRFKSHSDTFRIEILELRSTPGDFLERVRVRCENDMTAGIWLNDFAKVGFFQTTGPAGELYYREGQPHKAGQSSPVRADGKYSACEILFRLTAESTNTVWHSNISSSSGSTLTGQSKEAAGVDTTLRVPLELSAVQTNWPSAYERGSAIPLAKLGEDTILLIVK